VAQGPHGPGYLLAGSPISCRQLEADAGTVVKLVSQSSCPRNASCRKCIAVVTNSARNALGYTFYKTDVTNKFKHIRWVHIDNK